MFQSITPLFFNIDSSNFFTIPTAVKVYNHVTKILTIIMITKNSNRNNHYHNDDKNNNDYNS